MRIERKPKRLVRPWEGRSSAREWVALSSADFIAVPIHMGLLLAYEAAPPSPTSGIEEGLQKALCDYPELAGRIQEPVHPKGRPVILLNDAGAVLIEAHAQDPLHELLPFNPSLLLETLLVPPCLDAVELLLVQVTTFPCGGVTLGVAWHHQVADGKSIIDFMKGWTLRAQNFPILLSSPQDRTLLMGKECSCLMYDHNDFKIQSPPRKGFSQLLASNHQEVVRTLHLSAQVLKTIREKASIEEEHFTRFESLMGHLWRCITRARGLDNDNGEDKEKDNIETSLHITVNARTRMDPKIEEGYFGNVFCYTSTKARVKSLTREPLRYAAKLVKEAIKKVDESYMRSTLDYVELKERKLYEDGLPDGSQLSSPNLVVNSWANFPLYQLDFGFGSPLFAGTTFIPLEGMLIFLPSSLSDGSQEVLLSLPALAMENFLLTYMNNF